MKRKSFVEFVAPAVSAEPRVNPPSAEDSRLAEASGVARVGEAKTPVRLCS